MLIVFNLSAWFEKQLLSADILAKPTTIPAFFSPESLQKPWCILHVTDFEFEKYLGTLGTKKTGSF